MIRSRRPTLSLAAAGLTLLAALPASAQQATDFRWNKALSAGSRVRLSNVNGNVTVSPSGSNQVEVVGRRLRGSAEDIRVDVVESSDGIVVCVVRPRDRCDDDGIHSRRGDWDDDDRDDRWRGRIDLEVKVPRGLRLSAGSVSGNVEVTNVEGDLRASSVSGDVRVEGVRATRLSASSVSGDVMANAISLSGDGNFSSVSGRLSTVLGALSGSGDLKFSSVSGDVTAELPRDFSADLSMSTVSGRIDSSYPITLEGRTSSRRLEGRIGNGGRRLTVSTVSGDLRLRSRG